ncbi:MAG: hypothetical protein ACPGVK_02325 [Halocynthiibacter sp.]
MTLFPDTEFVFAPNCAKQLGQFPPTVFFHTDRLSLSKMRQGKLDFICQLVTFFQANGYGIEATKIQTNRVEEVALSDHRHIHILVHDHPVVAENVFYAVPAYLNGFWYFDALGSRNNSSIKFAAFEPENMGNRHPFENFERIKGWNVPKNRSKYTQVSTGAPLIDGAIGFFSQSFEAPHYNRHYIDVRPLLDAVIKHREARPIYIKPHPLQSEDELKILAGYHDPDAGIFVVEQSIHDILPKLSFCISASSAVAFEANFHKTPAILAGEVDFHHNSIVVHTEEDLKAAMGAIETQEFYYEKYVSWFCMWHLFQPHQKARNYERIGTILKRAGYKMKVTPAVTS